MFLNTNIEPFKRKICEILNGDILYFLIYLKAWLYISI